MSFNSEHPRDKTGRFINKTSIANYEKLQNKEIEHWTKSGSSNPNKYKGLNKEQKDIVDSFEQINSNRTLNEISALANNGVDFKTITEKYGEERVKQYLHVDNYMKLKKPHEGEITRLLRDDRDVWNKFNVGDNMEFDRFTSFGEKGNEFKIKGGNLRLHIVNNTRGKSISNLMSAKEEKEVMIDKGKYKVVKKEEGSINHIYLEEI
jgi:hypothetical protein